MSKENIIKVYEQVDAIDREEGLVAYARYHDSLAYYSKKYRVKLPRIIGAFSALSPNNDYTKNLRSLVTLLEGMRWGAEVEDCTVSTYKACRWRAWQYLHGLDFLQATRGHKTRNFYQNILDPDDPEPITIDGHMACVSIGQHMTMKDVVRARFKYQVLALNFIEVAHHVNLLPNQLQAMLWFTWKRINNVIYKPQLDMFRENNQWGTLVDPAEIRPFPIKTNNSSRHLTDSFEEPYLPGVISVADITTYVEQLSARVNIPDIFIGKRRRKDYGNIEELSKDFRDNGQITAITLRPPNEEDKSDPEYKGQPWALVAGGRRLAAAIQLNWTSIRAIDRENMDELKHRVLELAENLARKEMTFVEVVQAKQEMFLLRKEQNPDITQAEVAKEIGETAANFSRDLRVAEVIEQRPELKQASSKKAVIRQAVMAEHFEARLLRDEVTGNNYMIQLAQRLVTAEAEDWLKLLPEQFADLCIPDLPYGIDHFKQGHKTDAGEGGLSEFDDSEGVTLDLFVDIVPKMMRATKQSGWIICFISEANYEFLKDLFQGCCRKHYEYHGQHEPTDDCDYGLVEEPRWIWYRPNSNNNPRFPEIHAKNLYENILVFNRGNGKLLRPCGNLLSYDAEYGSRIHATQKPIELLKDLISRVTLPGETVIDPCFGSGSALAAGAALARDIHGCEKNEALRGPALGYVSQFYQGVAPKSSNNGTSDFLDSRLSDPDSEAGDESPDEIDLEALRELQAETDAAMRGG